MDKKWTLVRLADGRWSVRHKGEEKFILPHFGNGDPFDTAGRRIANEIEKMMNQIEREGCPIQ